MSVRRVLARRAKTDLSLRDLPVVLDSVLRLLCRTSGFFRFCLQANTRGYGDVTRRELARGAEQERRGFGRLAESVSSLMSYGAID